MHTITSVMFTDEERDVFERARLAIGVGFDSTVARLNRDARRKAAPADVPAGMPMDGEQAFRTASHLCARRDVHDRRSIERAAAMFDYLIPILVAESTETHWRQFVDVADDVPLDGLSSGLFADVGGAVAALTASRVAYLRDVLAARRIIEEALDVASALPDDDKYDDDLDLAASRVDAVMAESGQ